jgi:Rrf2 family protein
MLLSAMAEYTCLAALELAARHGDGRPVRLPDIAGRQNIPDRFLVHVLTRLKAAGLVTSTRGAGGGYHLARDPEDVSLADVLDVVEPAETAEQSRREASAMAAALREKWDEIAAVRRRALEATSLADLVAAGTGLQYVI